MNEIQKIRKKTGLSQSKFAEHFDIPVRTIQKWEIEQAAPPYYILQMMKKIIRFEQAEKEKDSLTIPQTLKLIFWDCNADELNLEKNSSYIIARMYNYGGIEGRMWVQMYYDKDTIVKAACSRRDLDPIVANYLKKEWNLKKSEMAYYQNNVHNSDWLRRVE